MIELIRPVTYDCPRVARAGGCSLTLSAGTIHDTEGRRLRERSLKRACNGSMSRSCWSCFTVLKKGCGFQVPDGLEVWGIGAQNILLSAQSGCVPLST